MLKRISVHALTLCFLLVTLLSLWGCSGSSPANDPAIRRNFQRIGDQVADLQADVEDLQARLDDLDTGDLSFSSPTTSDAPPTAGLASLRAVDPELRQQIASLQQEVDRLQGALEELDQAVNVTSVTTPRREESTPPPRGETVTETPRERGPDRGSYHEIESGETLTSIAADNGTTVAALLEANALPPNAIIYPGQMLFIPSSN